MTADHGGCAPGCRYRLLYQGSQASLSDMASRQGVALARVGRIRSALVEMAKRAEPESFARLESSLGVRLSTLDDELLLSHIEQLLAPDPLSRLLRERAAQASSVGTAEELRALSDALAQIGIHVPPGQSLQSLTNAVLDAAASFAATSSAVAVTAMGGSLGSAEVSGPPSGVTVPDPLEPARGLREPERTGFPDVPSGDSTPLAGGQADDRDLPGADDPFADFDPEAFIPDPPPGEVDDATSTPMDLASLFLDLPLPGDAEEPETVDDSPPVTPVEAESGTIPDPVDSEVIDPLPLGTGLAVSEPIRPQLSPAANAGKRRRPTSPSPKRSRVRIHAELPSSDDFDVPPEDLSPPVNVDEETQAAILSTIALPRPVFASDLVPVAGSAGVVASWETAMMSDLSHAPVRFIPAKKRHQARGSLIIPKQLLREHAEEFERSWWARCLEVHRGRTLYELGVLLHRVGDQVVSHDIPDDQMTASFRLNAPRGMVGVVVVNDADVSPGSSSRAAMVEAVERFLSDRLALLAVVSTFDDVDSLTDALAEEAKARGWRPLFPLVASRSWTFASDSGSSANLIAG